MSHLKTISIEQYIFKDKLESTNQFLTNILSKSKPQQNLCCYSYNQTHGKGQIGRFWYSGVSKNITLSYLFHFKTLTAQKQFYLNMAVSLAIKDLLDQIINKNTIKIKWPNDIYFGDKKLAGILIQNQLQGKNIGSSIIGLGLNVNEQNFPDTLPNPISLYQIKKKESSLLKIIHQLEAPISKYLSQLELNPHSLKSIYIKNLYRLNELHTFEDVLNKRKFNGIINGVSEEGKLMVLENEDLKAFNFRDIKFVI